MNKKEIIAELPYPSLNGITKNLSIIKIISPAYADAFGELTAILQYIYHHFNFEKLNKDDYAETLIGISLAEMRHFNILGLLIQKLGGDPIYTANPLKAYDFYSTQAVSYSKNPQKMLMDDISGEMKAIEEYKKMVKIIPDEQVSAVIARIILDEKVHLETLKTLLNNLCNNK